MTAALEQIAAGDARIDPVEDAAPRIMPLRPRPADKFLILKLH